MTKIEEISALLLDEIDTFQKAVSDLKQQTTKIENIKISINASEIKKTLSNFKDALNKINEKQYIQLVEIKNKLNKTTIFPKWMIVSFFSFFIITLTSISFVFFQYQKTKIIKEEAYKKGVNEMKTYIKSFLDDKPKASKEYQKWRNEK